MCMWDGKWTVEDGNDSDKYSVLCHALCVDCAHKCVCETGSFFTF